MKLTLRAIALTLLASTLLACGGGGGGSAPPAPTPPANRAPTANAGADQSVDEGSIVTLTGSGTDSDGTIRAYRWQQKSGSAVTLTGADTASARFTAHDVTTPETLSFTLTVTDNSGATASDEVQIIVRDPALVPPVSITLSGTVTYDAVPVKSSGSGLNYAGVTQKPVRGALIEAVNAATLSVLARTVTSAAGAYSLSVPSQTSVKLRVLAQMKKDTPAPSWDFKVVDNTRSQALYSLEGSAFNSGVADTVRDLNAGSGWGGSAYTGPRAAGPFAILDAVYSAYTKVLSADATAVFAPLTLNWSVNNRPVDGSPTTGAIGTSYYFNSQIYILGAADTDTDEYDGHVITHEWGHYFEDKFSRTDSIGGPHGAEEKLDMRVAFGEGWGNAWSAMATDNPLYFDTQGPSQGEGFSFNVESTTANPAGWYSEASVQSILYDLYDSGVDGSDNVALGFTPLYRVFTGSQKTTPALTSLFSFISALKTAEPGQSGAIDALVSAQSVNSAGIEAFGSNETNDGGLAPDTLPLYQNYPNLGFPTQVCVTDAEDSGGTNNKLGSHRYVRITIPATNKYRITLTRAVGGNDPDFEVYQNGRVATANAAAAATETLDTRLNAGEAIVVATDAGAYNGRICMSLTVMLAP